MKQVDYGIDRPERLRAFGMTGIVLIATGLASFIALRDSLDIWPELILQVCLWVGVLLLLVGGIMLWSSKSGKFGLAWKMIEELKWQGREKVLDVGCGRGLLTILAARKVPIGEVTGIDIWNQEQLSENSRDAAIENAQMERVSERIRFEDVDVLNMGFRSASFDKVISSLCLHGIQSRADRARALAEMVKVLKPGGEIAILDILHTREYSDVLQKLGLKNIRRSPMKFLYCLPTRYLLASKPLVTDKGLS